MRVVAAVLSWALIPLLAAPAALAAKDDTLLVSRAAGAAGKGGNATSGAPAISEDGRHVAFESLATNLDANDSHNEDPSDIFVRNIVDDTLTLVDRASGANGQPANSGAHNPAISADGRYIAFETFAWNLDPAVSDPDNETGQIYVRDLKTNKTRLVSRANGAAGSPGASDSTDASMSGDGRYVAFASESTNLSPQDPNSFADIFVRDLKTNTTRLVSLPTPGKTKDGYTFEPQIAADGRFVAFSSTRSDLYPQGKGTLSAVFVRDLQTDDIELVSRASGVAGEPADGGSSSASISADGRSVSFTSYGTNLAMDDDKRYPDAFVRDRQTATTILVTVVPGVPQDQSAGAPSNAQSISADGRYVSFGSQAPGLLLDNSNLNRFGQRISHVFVRDLQTGATTLVSRASGAAGALANDSSYGAPFSSDGRWVAYSSFATNLHPAAVAAATDDDLEDDETPQDVYVRDVLGPPAGAPDTFRGPGCPVRGRRVNGTRKPDVRTGHPGPDIMFGRSGNDTLRGRGGRDCVYGQAGADRLSGQSGGDRLSGGSGRDRLDGGTGRDRLLGGRGNDRLRGGSGADTLSDSYGRDRFSGGSGNDHINARDRTRRGSSRPDSVRCGTGQRDKAVVDAADHVAADCERVVRR